MALNDHYQKALFSKNFESNSPVIIIVKIATNTRNVDDCPCVTRVKELEEMEKMKMGKIGCQRAAYHSEDAIPLWHIHNNPQEEQLLSCVHTQISILFCTHLSIMEGFLGNGGDVEIEGARLNEQGRHGWRKGGKNEKERLVFMPGSQRACKSPRSVVEDSRRLIVIHHSWQPYCSGRAWQHCPGREKGGERARKTRRKINRKGCCLQNEQINSSMFKAEVEGEQGGEKTNVCVEGKGRGLGCYCHSVHPSLSACGSGSAAAGEVEWKWTDSK